MKIERIKGNTERRVLIGMIVDSIVLGRINDHWQRDLFRSRWANKIAELCVSHYRKFGKAPKQHIEHVFEEWSLTQKDKDTVKMAERFLSGLSSEYSAQRKKINRAVLLDQAAKHFNAVSLKRMNELIESDLELGHVEKAHERMRAYRQIDLERVKTINVLNDKSALQKAFAERQKPLIELPGLLGKFLNKALKREDFVSFLGPEKVGKTMWLVLLSFYAVLQRRRVAFFAAGDEGEDAMMQRFSLLAAKTPLFGTSTKLPISIIRKGKKRIVTTRTKRFLRPLNWKKAWSAFAGIRQNDLRSDDEYLKLSSYPNSSLSIAMVDAQLEQWAREGWVADVVVIDYADILLESAGASKDDQRHKINQTWKDMRRLSQERHVLLLTATQANTASYTDWIITRKNFSESKTKLAHVTDMIGLNQHDLEKPMGLTRINHVVGRGFAYSTTRCLYCAGAAGIGNPAIRTSF